MALINWKILFSGCGILTTGGIGLVTTNELSKVSVETYLKKEGNVLLSRNSSNDDSWKKLKDVIDSYSSSYDISSKYFRFIKEEDGKVNIEKLKDACSKTEKLTYSDLFSKNDFFIYEMFVFCSLTIKDFLGKQNIFSFNAGTTNPDENDKSKSETSLEKLKTHDPSLGNLDKTLEEIKEKYISKKKENPHLWKELIVWCNGVYNVTFSDENDILLKQAKAYCKKDISAI